MAIRQFSYEFSKFIRRQSASDMGGFQEFVFDIGSIKFFCAFRKAKCSCIDHFRGESVWKDGNLNRFHGRGCCQAKFRPILAKLVGCLVFDKITDLFWVFWLVHVHVPNHADTAVTKGLPKGFIWIVVVVVVVIIIRQTRGGIPYVHVFFVRRIPPIGFSQSTDFKFIEARANFL